MYSKILLSLLSLASFTFATTLRIQIPTSNLLPNPNTLSASTQATLTSGTSPQLHAPLRRGSILEFSNLTIPGSYLLDIYSQSHTFAPYRVDISPSTPGGEPSISGVWETYRGTLWSDKGPFLGGSDTSQTITVSAKCLTKKNFYDERPGFNPASLLKNPMILLGVVALAITFGMPKMMESMDPEMKEEFENMQKKGPVSGMTRAMAGQGAAGSAVGGFDLAGWMAGAQQGQPGSKSSGADAKDSGSTRERNIR